MADQPSSSRNRLGESRSPYLLQHAENPVHWYEWGEAAFAEARRREVPIFLSVGYSTCHWCHVMAHESFESDAIAAQLNAGFVNVKLDREERPDVDRIYMAYVQATTGSGGWPMSVFLTPDLKPFYGGTYFPPEDAHGRVGFASLLGRIAELWKDDREALIGYGEKSLELLSQNADRDLKGPIAESAVALELCLEQLRGDFDEEWGGFGGAPKFPMPGYLQLLLDEVAIDGDAELATVLRGTLQAMADGGIWDHLGGGFHRYSVDRYWHIPHYEKMLYDQGQLATIYANAYRLFGDESFLTVARSILKYLKRDMQSPEGALYAAEDADSDDGSGHSREGAFYVWEEAEIAELPELQAKLMIVAFDIKPDGNARPESDPHGELSGKNTLMQVRSDAELASAFAMGEAEVREALAAAKLTLLSRRSRRPRPHCDDKILVSWNALAISGACRVYQMSGDDSAKELALAAGEFLFNRMWDADTKSLARVYRAGSCGEQRGFAEDYAALALACLDLYESTLNAVWLERSAQIYEQLNARFWDAERGGYFATEAGDSQVLVRLRDDYDGAEPAASSMAALAGIRLAAVTGETVRLERARETVEAFAEQWKRSPRSMPLMLVAASRFLQGGQQIVLVGDPESAEFKKSVKLARRWRATRSVLIALDPKTAPCALLRENKILMSMRDAVASGAFAAYVCEDFTCQSPVKTAAALEDLLRKDDVAQGD